MKALFCFAVFGAALSSFGRPPGIPHFVPVKGDHEFTGRMIARPTQIEQLIYRGYAPAAAMQREAQTASLAGRYALEYRPQTDEYILKVPVGSNENRFAAELLAKGDFQYVEPDWKVFLTGDPNDPMYPQQWHHPTIHSSSAWNLLVGNNTITVALTDTGVRLDHQDLVAALVPGYNAVTHLAQQQGGDVGDTHGHGSHTAGIAGAVGNNGLGVSGVCQRVHIMPIKVTTGSGGSSSMSVLTGGALWAADHGARVVSTSFSGFDSSSSVQTTGDYIKHTRNGLYLWAAGNDGRNLTQGDWPDVTIVGASTSSDTRASFSAYGAAIDVFAPGVDILSTYDASSSAYTTMSGTSMATPCAAGVGAMILMANPSLTGQQVEDILYHTCDNIGAAATFGWGRVNLDSAVRLVYNTTWFTPSAVTMVRGIRTGGGTSEVAALDGQFYTARLGPVVSSGAQNSVVIQCDTTATISSIGTLTFNYSGMVNSGNVQQTIELFDWTANSWVSVDQEAAPTSVTQVSAQPSSPNRFMQGGTGLIRARLTYTPVGPLTSTLIVSVDQVATKTAP